MADTYWAIDEKTTDERTINREKLVEVIELAMGSDDEWSPEMRQEATDIADALLADGWCKP